MKGRPPERSDVTTITLNLVGFVRHIRDRGLRLGPHVTVDLAAALGHVGLHSRDDVYAALRSLIVVRPSEVPIFDEAFDRFFGGGWMRIATPPSPFEEPSDTKPVRFEAPVLIDFSTPDAQSGVEDVDEVVGGSYTERIASRDFAELTPEEVEIVRQLLARMVWRPADTVSRRWRPAKSGSRPDMRRTLRAMTKPEGDLIPISFRTRRPRKRPLVVLADVSGSMERYTEMFMHFIHAAQGRLGRVEAFVFGTRLTRITREMRRRSPAAALADVASAVEDWSGGTRIGEALGEFNRSWSRRVTSGGPIGLVISDGWDTGDPEILDVEMAGFARSVQRIVWLNPLAGRVGYRPETRGMQTVLPYVDDFLAAASLLDLREVVRLLESVSSTQASGGRV